MYYRQIEPPPDLTPWVECAWFLETALAPEGQLIVPDGRRELIFHFAARPLCAGLQQAGTLITSNLNQALELALTGTMKVFGVRLQPFASETGLAELEPRLESAPLLDDSTGITGRCRCRIHPPHRSRPRHRADRYLHALRPRGTAVAAALSAGHRPVPQSFRAGHAISIPDRPV